ncbi:MAG: ATP-binding cassette domain-containing protein, partial [Bacillota bacterium]
EVEQRVIESLESVNLDYEEFKDRSPFKLSGGQQRRIAIAGVLAMKPQVLILDEPTAGLDPKSRVELMTEITKFKEKYGLTVLLISHRMEEIFNLADRILVLHQGQLIFNQPPAKLVAKHQQLKELGLGIPKVTEVLFALQKQGFAVNTELFSVTAAKEEIIKVLRS